VGVFGDGVDGGDTEEVGFSGFDGFGFDGFGFDGGYGVERGYGVDFDRVG
jgi:hypothetical protein